MNITSEIKSKLCEYLFRLGDDRLILGHRLSEWCGHAPILEEDIALGNIALDLIGQAQAFLRLASELEGQGRSEDDLAFMREAINFRNCALVEQPKGDFAVTIARQFLFDVYDFLLMRELQKSKFDELAGICSKAFKESAYHLRHSSEWVLRLGDGTEESHNRIQAALDDLWMFTGELFADDDLEQSLKEKGVTPDLAALKTEWSHIVSETLKTATLKLPADQFMASGSRKGMHTEHLGHLLAEMQILPRSYPGAKW